jgi:Domain of unknown function (DU1801)
MDLLTQIRDYLAAQPATKRSDLQALHDRMLRVLPGGQLWFLDGKDDSGKVVSNPSIGYGLQTMRYANGDSREFYQIGISANTSGISVYLMGLADKTYLSTTYGKRLGKATVTGYCIKFRSLGQIDVDVLETAARDAIRQTST